MARNTALFNGRLDHLHSMTPRAYLLAGFLFILLAMSGWSHAETIPATQETTTPVTGVFRSPSSSSSYAGVSCTAITNGDYSPACAKHMANYPITDSVWRYEGTQNSCSASGVNVHEKQYSKTQGTLSSQYDFNYAWGSCANACPSGYTLSGGSCVRYTCPATGGWTLQGTSCTRTNPCETRKGQDSTGDGYFEAGIPSEACHDGCKSTFQLSDFSSQNPDGSYNGNPIDVIVRTVNGVDTYFTKGKYVYGDNTEACSGSAGPIPEALPPNSCGANQQGGFVQGRWMCINKESGKPEPTKPPASQQEQTKPPVQQPDGSQKQEREGTNPDGSTWKETIITKPDGTVEKSITGTPPEHKNDMEDFCTANPKAAVCAQSESSGGAACDAAPSCNGDAIQCAILRQQWENRCETKKLNQALGEGSTKAAALAQIGDNAMTGDSFDRSTLTESINLSTAINQDKFLPSSAGLQDKTFQLEGYTVTIPLSSANPWLEALGALNIALSLLVAARIIGGS